MLVQVDLGPCEREVQLVVGSVERRGVREEIVDIGAPLAIKCLSASEEAAVERDHRIARCGGCCHSNRNELGRCRGRVDGNGERVGCIGQGVSRMGRCASRPWGTDHGVPLAQALGEHECLFVRVPERVLPAERTGPRVLKHGSKTHDDLELPERINVEQHQEPSLVEWR